jgi:hypothetical protein
VFFIENVFCSCLKEKLGALRVGGYDQPVGYIKVSLNIKIFVACISIKILKPSKI